MNIMAPDSLAKWDNCYFCGKRQKYKPDPIILYLIKFSYVRRIPLFRITVKELRRQLQLCHFAC